MKGKNEKLGRMYSGVTAYYHDRHREDLLRTEFSAINYKVKIRRLDALLAECKISRVDYISIDTEGAELKVLRGIDLKAFDVSVVSVENNYRDPKLRKHMRDAAYDLVHVFAGFDELYVRRGLL